MLEWIEKKSQSGHFISQEGHEACSNAAEILSRPQRLRNRPLVRAYPFTRVSSSCSSSCPAAGSCISAFHALYNWRFESDQRPILDILKSHCTILALI